MDNLVSNNNYTAILDNKQLKFTSKLSSSSAILFKVDNAGLNISSDFSFEMEINATTKSASDQYGLVFATSTKDTTEYFKINREQKMFPGNSAWYSYYTQLHKNAINKTGTNRLKVVKIDGIIHYFINNVYVYQTEMEIFGSGNNFGFIVPAESVVWIDNLKIGTKQSTNTISKVKSFNNITFSIVKINDAQNSISEK